MDIFNCSVPRYSYTIDGNDRVISVCENWNSFGCIHGAGEGSLGSSMLNQSIWSLIACDDTVHLYQILVERVRELKMSAHIPIRCDSSGVRNILNLEVSSGAGRNVTFKTQGTGTTQEDSLPLPVSKRVRGDKLLRLCSYCRKIDLGNGQWEEVEVVLARMNLSDQVLPGLTHGVCNSCYKELMAQVEVLKKQKLN